MSPTLALACVPGVVDPKAGGGPGRGHEPARLILAGEVVGATETAVVTSGLLSDLVTRGLPTDRTLLFVIDGAPGLRRAITDVFGSLGVVQRCQVHKLRNVLGHLPERLHASVGKALRDAWDLESADRAARVLKQLAGSLERDHPARRRPSGRASRRR